eukprot:symbB.v1.2.016558.t1/scaffold1261.1/size128201/3
MPWQPSKRSAVVPVRARRAVAQLREGVPLPRGVEEELRESVERKVHQSRHGGHFRHRKRCSQNGCGTACVGGSNKVAARGDFKDEA